MSTLIFRSTKKTPSRLQCQSEIEAWLLAAKEQQPLPIDFTVYVTAKDYRSLRRSVELHRGLLPSDAVATFPKYGCEFFVDVGRHRLAVKMFEEKPT